MGGGGAGVEQGWRTSDSTRTSTMRPAFKSRRGSHTWVEFVLGLFLAPRGSSPDTPFFFSPQKYVLICTLVTSKDRM